MGVADRDYTKAGWDDLPYAFNWRAPLTPGVKGLLAVYGMTAAVQLAFSLMGRGPALLALVGLPATQAQLWTAPWTLVTSWCFFPLSAWWVLSLAGTLWLLGRKLEDTLGLGAFLSLFFVGNLLGALAAVVWPGAGPAAGPVGGVTAIAAVFALALPRLRVWGEMRASVLVAAGLMLGAAALLFTSEPTVPRAALLGGLGAALAERSFQWALARRGPTRRRRAAPASVRVAPPAVPDTLPDDVELVPTAVAAGDSGAADKARVDALLDKMNRLGGFEHLSEAERDFLRAAGRRLNR